MSRFVRGVMSIALLLTIGLLSIPPSAIAASPDKRFLLPVSGPRQPTVRLSVEDYGKGRPIVLLHGLGASAYSWRRVIPFLRDRFRILAVDLRGHGLSDKPFDQHYAPTAQAELIRAVLARLNLRRSILVGHSFGGLVALTAAVQAQHAGERQIAKLVLMNAPAFPQALTPAIGFLRQPVLPYAVLSLVPPQVPIALALLTEAVGMGHITRRDIDIYAQPLFASGARHALITTARQIIPANARAVMAGYSHLRQPSLVVWCKGDRVVPLATGKRLAKTLPRARLKVLSACDHVTPEQAPRSVAKLIAAFAGR